MHEFETASPQPADPTERPDFVTALARGLAVIRAFGPDSPRMTLADIARRVALPRATVRRSLITLATLGYVDTDGRSFTLTPKVLALGNSYLTTSPLPRAAQPLLERLADTTHEGCWAATLDEDEVLLVAGAKTNRLLSAGLSIGSRLPAFCSALGRVLLAGSPDEKLDAYFARLSPRSHTPRTTVEPSAIRRAILDARAAGYAIADGEVETGLCSIAVPITDPRGKTVAALNATAPSERVRSSEMVERFLPLLKRAADDLRPILL
ncbi:MAG: IclR family transcriptional regulator C-terminal domain-containing protein [Xanthobacteraceae bacterium]